MADQLPENEYRDYYGPDFRLVIPTKNEMHNENTQTYLDALCKRLLHNLSQCAPPSPLQRHDIATHAPRATELLCLVWMSSCHGSCICSTWRSSTHCGVWWHIKQASQWPSHICTSVSGAVALPTHQTLQVSAPLPQLWRLALDLQDLEFRVYGSD